LHYGDLVCEEVSLDEVRALPPMFSSYETNVVYRLEVERDGARVRWTLGEELLPREFRKRYDSGRVDDWVEPYLDQTPVHTLHFMAARVGGEVCGLVTWQKVAWNDTVWLVDIRTRREDRRSGVGSALLERLKSETAGLRARGISVETQINNYPAIRFYRKHGFEFSGFNDHLYTNRDLEKQDVALFLFWERNRAH
jgi:ribosomal protein S18 acetylase RimI-like enzyme